MKAGDTVKAYGIEWEILDTDFNGGILCLAKEPLCSKAFDDGNNNYYPKSSICKYLAELTDSLRRQGAEFKTVTLDMRADDGTRFDKDNFSVNGLFLLTERLYQDYRQYISDKSDWWWLATAYSFAYDYSYYARLVRMDGSLINGSACYGHRGVVPACVFSFLPDQGDKMTLEKPCEDCINRQAAIDAFERFIHELGIEDEPYNYGEMALSAKNVPSVTSQPKMGCEGCIYEKTGNNSTYPCSHCGRCYTDKYKAESEE